MSDDKHRRCPVCGDPLDKVRIVKNVCDVCGKEFSSEDVCRKGHKVCPECRASMTVDTIDRICTSTKSRNPYEILVEIISEPPMRMHDVRHHMAVGSALLAAYRNSGGAADFDNALKEIQKRGGSAPPGACGFIGNCGAAVSTGAFYSVVTEASPYSKGPQWGDPNLLTGKCLIAMSEVGGPRCCKRNSFIAMGIAVEQVKEKLGIAMEYPEKIECGFSDRNEECIEERCPFYVKK
ncbi:MAG: SAM-dependent methyltransferase [Thermoplasmatales archaeon]|jgi:hypothetical protein|nr:SAM-dependent methyltransferase [Thermoplasmatales archaeon]